MTNKRCAAVSVTYQALSPDLITHILQLIAQLCGKCSVLVLIDTFHFVVPSRHPERLSVGFPTRGLSLSPRCCHVQLRKEKKRKDYTFRR